MVGSRQVGRAALLGIRRNVGERWFWRGALRGESPRTREGRRPDRPKSNERVMRSEERENTIARLIHGRRLIAAE